MRKQTRQNILLNYNLSEIDLSHAFPCSHYDLKWIENTRKEKFKNSVWGHISVMYKCGVYDDVENEVAEERISIGWQAR